MTGISTGMRTGSRSGKRTNWLPDLALRLYIAFGICCLLLAARAVPQALRLDQTPEIRQLEQPTSEFLAKIGVRGHVQVLQTTPFHLLVQVNCTESSRQALERQLHDLYGIQEYRGEQLIVLNGQPPLRWRDFPHLALALLGLGNGLLALAAWTLTSRWFAKWLTRPSTRRLPSRLLRVSPLLTAAAVVWAAAPPLLLPLNLLLLLWLRTRRKQRLNLMSRRTIVHGPQEAAIILMSYPPEHSAQVFKELGPDAVHTITLEISKLPPISPEIRAAVLATFDGCLKQISRNASSEKVDPVLFTRALTGYYLNSPLRGQLVGLSQPKRPRFNWSWLPKAARILSGSSIAALTLIPIAWSWQPQHQAPLQSELDRLLSTRPTAVVTLERNGETRALVGLRTDNLNALRPLVSERALQLGLDPQRVSCLGIKRTYYIPYRLLGGILMAIGCIALWRRPRSQARVAEAGTPPTASAPPPPPAAPPAPAKATQESVLKLLPVDDITMEVGRGLLSLVDPNQGSKLLERVTTVRRHIALELGYILPGIRFRDNLGLNTSEYVIRIRDQEVGRGLIQVNRYLCILPEERLDSLEGERVLDPTFGLPAIWIAPALREQAEKLGATILDPVSVVAAQLTKIARERAADIFTLNAGLELLKQPQLEAVVEHLQRRGFDHLDLWKILRELLRQQVSIRDLTSILQGLLEMCDSDTPHDLMVEVARLAVRDSIVRELCATDKTKPPQDLILWRVTPELLDLLDDQPGELLCKLTLVGERMRNAGHVAALLVPPDLRCEVQKVVLPLRAMRVLSTAEIPDWVNLRFFHGEGKL